MPEISTLATAVDSALDTLETAAADFLTEARRLDSAARGTVSHRVRHDYASAESYLKHAVGRRMFRASHPDDEGRDDYNLADRFPAPAE